MWIPVKKALSLLLCLALGIGLLALTSERVQATEIVDSATSGEKLTWTLDDAGTLTISGSGAMGNYSFGRSPFYSNRNAIKSIIIEPGVTSIGNHAFYECRMLKSVSIPDSVISIGNSVFAYCTSLTGVTIPNGVTSIGENIFADCYSLTSVTIPKTVTSIGDAAFYNCSGLTSVTIPASVTSIGNLAFSSCSNLKDVYFGGTQEQWNAIEIGTNNPILTPTYIRLITFYANGGEGSMDEQTILLNTAAALTANAFTRSGYTFTGWNTKADGSGEAYADKATMTLDDDLTLYAQWAVKPPLLPPTNLTAKVSNAGVKLTWTGADGATRYRMYKRIYSGSSWGAWVLISSNVTGTSWTDTDVKSGTQYMYRMRALIGGTWYGYSNNATVTVPIAPTVTVSTVKATASAGKNTVTWNALEGATRYRMYKRVYSGSAWGDWVLVSTTLTGTSWTDTDVKGGTQYMYRMRALIGGSWYGYSNSATVTAK